MLRVKFHVCTTSKLRPFIPVDFIDKYVTALNEHVVPFYVWQSSGVLSVQYEAGQVVEAPPRSLFHCKNQVDDGDTTIVHQFYDYGTFRANTADYAGIAGGHISYIVHPHSPTAAPQAPSGRNVDSVLRIAAHELDHNIGVGHLLGGRLGINRVSIGWWGWNSLGIISDDSMFPEVFSCNAMHNLGWPVGEDHPACALVPELPPVRNVKIEEVVDGIGHLSWREPIPFDNPVPITGYRIGIWRNNGSTLDSVERHDLPTKARDFRLPQHLLPGEYQVDVQALTDIGDSIPASVPLPILGDSYEVSARSISVPPEWYSGNIEIDYPIEYELSWDPVPNALSYEIYSPRSCSSSAISYGSNSFCVSTEPRISFSESRAELVEGTTYFLPVYARLSETLRFPVGTAQFTAQRNIPEWWTGRQSTPPF